MHTPCFVLFHCHKFCKLSVHVIWLNKSPQKEEWKLRSHNSLPLQTLKTHLFLLANWDSLTQLWRLRISVNSISIGDNIFTFLSFIKLPTMTHKNKINKSHHLILFNFQEIKLLGCWGRHSLHLWSFHVAHPQQRCRSAVAFCWRVTQTSTWWESPPAWGHRPPRPGDFSHHYVPWQQSLIFH